MVAKRLGGPLVRPGYISELQLPPMALLREERKPSEPARARASDESPSVLLRRACAALHEQCAFSLWLLDRLQAFTGREPLSAALEGLASRLELADESGLPAAERLFHMRDLLDDARLLLIVSLDDICQTGAPDDTGRCRPLYDLRFTLPSDRH